MPQYDYRCTQCQQPISIIRTISEHAVLPSPKEEQDASITECSVQLLSLPPQSTPHQWKQEITSSPTVVKGSSWGPGKGYW